MFLLFLQNKNYLNFYINLRYCIFLYILNFKCGKREIGTQLNIKEAGGQGGRRPKGGLF